MSTCTFTDACSQTIHNVDWWILSTVIVQSDQWTPASRQCRHCQFICRQAIEYLFTSPDWRDCKRLCNDCIAGSQRRLHPLSLLSSFSDRTSEFVARLVIYVCRSLSQPAVEFRQATLLWLLVYIGLIYTNIIRIFEYLHAEGLFEYSLASTLNLSYGCIL